MTMSRQRELGQYMTPLDIAKKMCDHFSTPFETMRVLDPACGDGNLLLAVVDKMLEMGLDDIHKRIFGIDIDPEMLSIARNRLGEKLGKEVADKITLLNLDFLEVSNSIFGVNLFPEINAIISNPPYGNLREYDFFKAVDRYFGKGIEKVFLLPLAFIDRVSGEGISSEIIDGRPFGVTTGHVILHHKSGTPYSIKPTKGLQKNSSSFEVLSGLKLYEVGAGTPPQTKEILEAKPFSSDQYVPGWLPCLRTGDIQPFKISIGRLFVNYGPHLAHPKTLDRFTGPKLFIRRVPIWESKTIGVAYSNETVLCAGDVLIVRHITDDIDLLKGLEQFLNSREAADIIYRNRPSVKHRMSYPKISGKDLNLLFEKYLPREEELRFLIEKQV